MATKTKLVKEKQAEKTTQEDAEYITGKSRGLNKQISVAEATAIANEFINLRVMFYGTIPGESNIDISKYSGRVHALQRKYEGLIRIQDKKAMEFNINGIYSRIELGFKDNIIYQYKMGVNSSNGATTISMVPLLEIT